MADEWYSPDIARATCVANIVADIEDHLVTDASGKRAINIATFMALAATRLAAIPNPATAEVLYATPEVLRGTNVRPIAESLQASLAALEATNTGGDNATNLGALLAEARAKSEAVTAAFNYLVTDSSSNTAEVRAILAQIENELPLADEANPQTTYWRVTFVNDWENESAPSAVSSALDVGKNDTVEIDMPTVPTGRDIAYWRVYRSNTGSEAAAWQYVPYASNELGIPIATTQLTDDVPNSELQETCPSLIWTHPRTDLGSIVDMANGIHIGFFDNTLCPTPNYVPYAFPEEYQRTVEAPIVGIAAWEQSAFVGTRGKPYFIDGTDPANLSLRKLDSNQACVSARGICSTQAGVVYPSPDGLCLATPAGVQLLTGQHFSREEWQALSPEDLLVAEHDGVVYFTPRDAPVVPVQPDYLWIYSGGGSASLLNGNQRWAVTSLGSSTSRSTHTNAVTGKTYCEFQVMSWSSNAPMAIGITNGAPGNAFYQAGAWDMFSGNGGCGLPSTQGIYTNGALTSSSATYAFTTAHRIGIAVDVTLGKIWFSKDGVWLAGDPAAGTGQSLSFTPGASTWRFYANVYSCLVSGGTYHVDIFPSSGSQSYSAPSGFTPFQPY